MATITVEAGNAQIDGAGYQPRGAALDLFYSRQPEVLLSGAAGTGKSRALLEKLYFCCQRWPGSRSLIVRKTRASLTESGLVTWEQKVLPAKSPLKKGTARRYRQIYDFPNGSAVVVGGMDEPTRVMSTEYDLIVCLEATELTITDWENLTTRLRNGVMPFQQLIADCNPAGARHWLKLRADSGSTLMLNSKHEDNPRLFDQVRRCWTPEGEAYIRVLNSLTGVRKLRLRDGLWAMSEGMVYDGWNPAKHHVFRFEIPVNWLRFWAVDFGFKNPFCWQAWAQDHDGRLYLYKEIYQTNRLVEDLAKDILAATKGEPTPTAIITDHDAEDRATLERHLGMGTVPAIKEIRAGIQSVSARLRDDRLFVLRDSLVSRDETLAEKKKPTQTVEEFDGYVWAENATGMKEVPVDRDNHGMDALRYVVHYLDFGLSEGIFL